MAEFSVTQSLFGINPQSASDAARLLQQKEDDAFATRLATLEPSQRNVFLATRGGAMAGRGVVDVAKGMMGVETAPREVQLAQATQAIMQQMQQEGADPSDPRTRLEVARRLLAAGFGQEATLLARETQAEMLNNDKARAEIAFKNSSAVKNEADARNVRTPTQRLAETGKYTPASLAKYNVTGNMDDLVIIPGWKQVETGDGIFLVPEGVAAFDANNQKIKVGDPKPAGGGDKHIRDAQGKLKMLIAENRKPGETVDELLLRLERENPELRSDIYAQARIAYGAEHMNKALGTLDDPKEGEMKLMTFVPRMMREYSTFRQSFEKEWGGKSPVNIADLADTANIIRQISNNNPGDKIMSTVVLNKISDPKKRKFITDAMSVFYPDVRLQTGAAITAAEWQIALEQMLPYADDPDGGKFKLERMRDMLHDQYRTLEATPNGRRFLSRNKIDWNLGGNVDRAALKSRIKGLVEQGVPDDKILEQLSPAEREVAKTWMK